MILSPILCFCYSSYPSMQRLSTWVLASGQWQNRWNVMAGGSIIVALPPLVFFFFLQRQFVSGLTLGAQKG